MSLKRVRYEATVQRLQVEHGHALRVIIVQFASLDGEGLAPTDFTVSGVEGSPLPDERASLIDG